MSLSSTVTTDFIVRFDPYVCDTIEKLTQTFGAFPGNLEDALESALSAYDITINPPKGIENDPGYYVYPVKFTYPLEFRTDAIVEADDLETVIYDELVKIQAGINELEVDNFDYDFSESVIKKVVSDILEGVPVRRAVICEISGEDIDVQAKLSKWWDGYVDNWYDSIRCENDRDSDDDSFMPDEYYAFVSYRPGQQTARLTASCNDGVEWAYLDLDLFLEDLEADGIRPGVDVAVKQYGSDVDSFELKFLKMSPEEFLRIV